MEENHLFKAAAELAKAMNRVADENLPSRLSGIVKLHAKIAVGSAFIPVPGADIAATGVNIWTMYVRINKELNLPFGENVLKSLAAGIMTNVGGAAASLVVVASAAKFLPGLGTVAGAAVMAATIYAVTIASGIVYMKAVAKLLNAKSAHQVTEADLKTAADEVMKDKQAMRDIVKDAKKTYKDTKGTSGETQEQAIVPPPAPPSPTPAVAPTAFLAAGGKTSGPFPADEIQRMKRSGRLAPGTHFWMPGMADWLSIDRFPASRP